jgi:hypothetical protein
VLIKKWSVPAAIKWKRRMENNSRYLKTFLFKIVIPVIKMFITAALGQTVQAVMKLPASNKLINLPSITAKQNFHLLENISLSVAIIVIRIQPVTR